jgi:L-methionine (R)-S-oxide reductase
MAEEIIISETADKAEKYRQLLPQIRSLIRGEEDLTANLANIAAALKQSMGFFWVGFYLVTDNQLVLGPFQGPVACTRIKYGKGVCGTAWERAETIIVEDVDKFPGHIACSSASRSEIVVPLMGADGKVAGVIDVDSDKLSDFDAADALYLGEIARITEELFKATT